MKVGGKDGNAPRSYIFPINSSFHWPQISHLSWLASTVCFGDGLIVISSTILKFDASSPYTKQMVCEGYKGY